jgi:hypothetical protein
MIVDYLIIIFILEFSLSSLLFYMIYKIMHYYYQNRNRIYIDNEIQNNNTEILREDSDGEFCETNHVNEEKVV